MIATPGNPPVIPAEEAFIITVGVSHRHKDHDCARAIRALHKAGFQAAQTSDEAILALAEQVKLNIALKENDE